MSYDKRKHSRVNLDTALWINGSELEQELYRRALPALRDLGVPMHLKGFNYLLHAVIYTAKDPTYIHDVTSRLYFEVGELFDATWGSVERNIRTAIERTFESGDIQLLHDYFGNAIKDKSGKTFSSSFICCVAANIRLEVMGDESLLASSRK